MKKAFFLVIFGIIGTCGPMLVSAQGILGNNQISRDAIGLRVSPNPENFSPLEWYNANIKIKGAPQSLIVDGYEAVRDGRTVYVNGAKIAQVSRCSGRNTVCRGDADCGREICVPSSVPELYTNIYIISYNQQPESATTDIFGQLLQYWKFNPDVKNCSNDTTKLCAGDSECTGGAVCQPTGFCSGATSKACLLDSDCGVTEYCNSKKSAIIRDVKRLSDLRSTKDKLDKLNNVTLSYPTLSRGTYLSNRTISTWPSWEETFKPALGVDLPSDPINKLGLCGGGRLENYDPRTCWDEIAKKYSATADPLGLPNNSFAYYYQYGSAENTFRLCGISESGFYQGQPIGSPICKINACTSCTGKQCGTNGCGVSCGTCAEDQVCYKYQCRRTGSIIQTEN
ncbi:hypothetical protein IPN41_01940 [Candidatus Falkowbacteria bacterium]|nr:MAG: hypothetical protein IPN41_01940 [Candidatus Falkowbacteria bacterium]